MINGRPPQYFLFIIGHPKHEDTLNEGLSVVDVEVDIIGSGGRSAVAVASFGQVFRKNMCAVFIAGGRRVKSKLAEKNVYNALTNDDLVASAM